MGVWARGSGSSRGGSGFSRGPAFQAPGQACCPSALLQALKKSPPGFPWWLSG